MPDVGTVDVEGSVTITPADTTTYTLTAVGPGGRAEAQATVSVMFPPPKAEPMTVGSGDPVILTWTTAYARQCVIEPELGEVALSGSISVTPVATTTYTLTATGPAGSATDTLTVNVVPKPQITFSAEPPAIKPGDPVTLTWAVSHADSCVVEPDVGSVGTSGSVTITLSIATVYTLTATGPGGTVTATASISVGAPIDIQILYPADGTTINRPDTMVRGTVANTSGKETGITVNGKVAMVYGNEFVINHLPLEEGNNTITVIATDADGYTRTATANVTTTLPEHHIRTSANIEAANAPLETALRIDGTFSIDDSALNYSGPGTIDFLETEADAYRIGMTDEGIYYFTAEVVYDTVTYTDTIAIVVVDASALDALLQQKWADMKIRLGNGDIAGALEHFSEGTKPLFEYNFNLLSGHLSEILAGMQSITLVEIMEDQAVYNLVGEQGGQTFSFHLLFIKSADGIWRIINF